MFKKSYRTMKTPKFQNFYMPAEWYPHQCCWMGWPTRASNWPLALEQVQTNFLAVAQAIAQFEPVKVLVLPEHFAAVKQRCGNKIEVIALPLDDTWLRDTAPTFVINGKGQIAGIDWPFNAWGENQERLTDYQQDALLAQRLLEYLQVPRYVAPLFVEGGAFHVDGEGTILTTEECLLNPSRNPHLTKQEIEELLCEYLGATKVIWLGQGLRDDETSGHVDTIACFARPGVVVALTSNNPQDENYKALQDNLYRLRSAKDAQGRRLEVVEIEQPKARYDDRNGLRLTLSYINFYLANGGIVVPVFNDAADTQAVLKLRKTFVNHQVTPIAALGLFYGGGGIHCMTQQQPVVRY
jgi:agmatine deiminase